MFIYYFVSYSGDEFFLKSQSNDYKFKPEEFCKDFIPDEYNGWDGLNFKYKKFNVYQLPENKDYVKINLMFGEHYRVFPDKLEEFDVAYFTDVYSPRIYNSDGEEL